MINNLLWLEEYVSSVFLLSIQIRFKEKYYWRTWTESGLLNNFMQRITNCEKNISLKRNSFLSMWLISSASTSYTAGERSVD